MMSVPFSVLSVILGLQCVCGQSQSESYEDHMPTHLWQLDDRHHGYSFNSHTLYAYLYNVPRVPGPYNASTNGALKFRGTTGSFVKIPISDGALNAISAFAWVMLLKPASVPSEGVILEYWDGTGGIRLRQDGKDLIAEAHTASTSPEILTVEKKNLFVQGEWKFITLTFNNKFKIITADYNETEEPKDQEEIPVVAGTVLRGTGDVRLGASYNTSLPGFNGSMSCLRFYDVFIENFQEGYVLSCDPDSAILNGTLDDLSEHTLDYVPGPHVAVPIATAALTTATTPIPLVYFSLDILTIVDSCVELTREPELATFTADTSIMADIQVNTLGACASACASASGCQAVTVEKLVMDSQLYGRCLMAGVGYQTTVATDFYLFHMTF